ncbi:hypothetical protein ETH_00034920 [Eimeria tenella]|uniref:Chromo domain-containing protein n=1 Tax=Eimeria tenella TaxID=5802 RepID=U6KUK7_EIMTE|nr:hypothetical protein ETH_00034920 [Eimeria tenella]CDJ40598.1 hypothetical protein ETH_00034920 [Eimeria tenella]|eukprot:XP_013231348.1 hypothetical protein ETH_00034920 [Eimeria tenella]
MRQSPGPHRAKWQQNSYADSKQRAVEYSVGDNVWLSNIHLPTLNNCSMFEPRYQGPFHIKGRTGSMAYRLAVLPTYECHNVFRVPQLVPHCPREPDGVPQEATVGWPRTRDVAGNLTDHYPVDKILGQRGSGDDAYYLVKWSDAREPCAAWEPAQLLVGRPVLVRAWRRRQHRQLRAQPNPLPLTTPISPKALP